MSWPVFQVLIDDSKCHLREAARLQGDRQCYEGVESISRCATAIASRRAKASDGWACPVLAMTGPESTW
jgi:hypothetical protein